MTKHYEDIKLLGQNGESLSAAQLRELTLIAADYNPKTVGDFMQKATNKLIQKLEATKVEFFSKDGVVTDQRVVEDTNAQLKASSELLSLGIEVMSLRKRAETTNEASKEININLSGWTVQTTPIEKNVTPHDSTS